MRLLVKEGAESYPVGVVDVYPWAKLSLGQPLPFGAMWYTMPPDSTARQDCHPEVELSVVVNGTASVEASGKITDVPAGGMFLLDSEEAHVIHNRSADQPLTVFSAYWMPLDGSGDSAAAAEAAAAEAAGAEAAGAGAAGAETQVRS